MTRTMIIDTPGKVGEDVLIQGWVNVRRDHGKLIFLDLRDRSGILQSVVLPNHEEAHKAGQELRTEYCVEIKGTINARPEKNVNKDLPTGGVELEVKEIEILGESQTPPFDVTTDGSDIDEEVRLKYRYLDLRRPRLASNIRLRNEYMQAVRQALLKREFSEIETPLLSKATMEGARDFIVPSRFQPGKFYALPQSPQQYKQLL